MKRRSIHRPSRRSLVAIAIILLIAALAGYIWLSFGSWKEYESRLMAERQSYDQLRDDALNGKTTDDRLKALRLLDDKLATRDTLCDMNPLFSWQANVVPVLKEGVKECHAAVKRLDVLAGPLGELRDYLDVGIRLRESVAKLSPGSALSESNWSQLGLERAKAFQTEVTSIEASGDGAKLKAEAKQLADELVKNWQALIKANAAKDKVGFLSAATAVAKSYADFGSLADSSDVVITKKITEITKAYEAL